MLADDLLTPLNQELVFALATDDLMLFSRGRWKGASSWRRGFDSALQTHRVCRNEKKDVNGTLDATCIGVDCCGGTHLAPHSPKLAKVLVGISTFLRDPCASAVELSALLGHLSWFALLSRATFACFDTVYNYARGDTQTQERIPQAACSELLLFLLLAPYLEADLTRDWQNCLIACDASPSFGFGVNVAPCPQHIIRSVARHATKREVFVRLARSETDDEPERPRRGSPLRLPLSKAAFATVISAQSKYAAHSGSLEAQGLILALRWALRSSKRHSRRTAVLIDAQAVLGAAAKGRSSASTLRTDMRRVAALVLGGDLLLKPVYVPSEDNPSDLASRGVVNRWRPRRYIFPHKSRMKYGKQVVISRC